MVLLTVSGNIDMYPQISKEAWDWLTLRLFSIERIVCEEGSSKVDMAGSQKDRDALQKEIDLLREFFYHQDCVRGQGTYSL